MLGDVLDQLMEDMAAAGVTAADVTVVTGSASDAITGALQKDERREDGDERLDVYSCTWVVKRSALSAIPGSGTTVTHGSIVWTVQRVDPVGPPGWALRCERRQQRGRP